MENLENLLKKIEEKLEKKRENDPSIKARSSKKAIEVFNIITNKKKSPDIDLITKLKGLYDNNLQKERVGNKSSKERVKDNPLLMFSMEDYENMCKDKETFDKIVFDLNIDKKKLKKICEHIQIFKDNIDSSPNTIKEKMKATTSPIKDLSLIGMKLHHLPEDIIRIITEQKLYALFINKFKKTDKYKLIDGIPEDKLNQKYLSENSKAIDFILEKKIPIDYFYLSRNKSSKAMEILKEHLKEYPDDENIAWLFLCKSEIPEAFEILKANPGKIHFGHIQDNTNPDVIKYLQEQDKIHYYMLSNKTSPIAIQLLEEQIMTGPNILNWKFLSANEKAIELLNKNPGRINWEGLSSNPNPEAIKLLKEEYYKNPESNRINFEELSLNTNPEIIELLKKNHVKIDWRNFLNNPNPKGIKYIKELLEINPNDENIYWDILSKNTAPEAIELLKDRIEFENNLSEEEYDKIKYKYKIDWKEISKNPKAIELIKERIIYEKNLPKYRLKKLNSLVKIDWDALSTNPSIFTIIEDI